MMSTGKLMPKVNELRNCYLYTRRPPGVGCQLPGWTHRETWLPAKKVDDQFCFGVVVYDEPLDMGVVELYELRPEPAHRILFKETDEAIRRVHSLIHAACARANKQNKEYVGFQRLRSGGLRLVAAKNNCGGKSSARMGMMVSDWTDNALYRLQEERFIPHDWPLDEWFDANPVRLWDGKRVSR